MSVSIRGIKKFLEWMDFLREEGWHQSTWKRLAALWWMHHDDDGHLK